jgi:hypothetical protein
MTFNINDFKAKINQYGGLARTSFFVVSIFEKNIDRPSNQYMPSGDLRFFCKSVNMPSINLAVTDFKPQGFGMAHTMPIGINSDPLSCIFILDSDHKVLSFFHEWIQRVVNYDLSGGAFSSVDDKYPYEIGYKKEYALDMEIRFYSTHDENAFYLCTLKDVYPTQIGSINLSWEENNSLASLPVSFSYSEIRMQAAITGSPAERFSRGTGYLQYLNTVGGYGQSIEQSGLPRSIQDAVNKFTTIKNDFARLKNLFK